MSARSRARKARLIVATHSPAEVLRIHARAEGEFDYLLADAIYEAVRDACGPPEVRYRLTPLGERALEGAG